MDLLQANVKHCYFRYLRAAFGSALISSVYSMVDMAMVGQYQGPDGTAALAVVAPVWNIIYSLGLLAGIGGCVLGSAAKGRGDERTKNEYFTAACICAGVLAAASWAAVLFWQTPMLRAFGADGTLLSIARQYLQPIRFAVPLFLINQMLAAWLRNDGAPGLATAAVLAGGVFNIFGDYAFVFLLDTGACGAGLATALGAAISFAVMLGHFFSKKNTLRLVRPARPAGKLRQIVTAGFSTFFIDIAMGLLTMLFNRQIMRWLGADALAVYGVIVNISTFVQCCAYSVGQAAAAYHFCEFRRAAVGAHPPDAALRVVRRRLFQYCVDGAGVRLPAWVCAHLHGAHASNLAHRAVHSAQLRPLVPSSAAEYLLHLLLPGADEAGRGVLRLGGARPRAQRRARSCCCPPLWRPMLCGLPCPSPRPWWPRQPPY